MFRRTATECSGSIPEIDAMVKARLRRLGGQHKGSIRGPRDAQCPTIDDDRFA